MPINITPALRDALNACLDIERNLILIGKRTDPQRKADLVQYRVRFAEQTGELSRLIEAETALQSEPELAMEMHSRLSAFRFAISQHQASWPAVSIDDDAAAYAASARSTQVKSTLFWDWCSEYLALGRQ